MHLKVSEALRVLIYSYTKHAMPQDVVVTITDVDECSELNLPCNGGTCTNTPGTFTCDCTGTGFEGPTCGTGK